jgi:hypothetical protein
VAKFGFGFTDAFYGFFFAKHDPELSFFQYFFQVVGFATENTSPALGHQGKVNNNVFISWSRTDADYKTLGQRVFRDFCKSLSKAITHLERLFIADPLENFIEIP